MNIGRRDVLKQGIWACAALLGCASMDMHGDGGTSDAGDSDGGASDGASATGTDPDGAVGTWTVPAPIFVMGSTATLDLVSTLPPGTAPGGVFSVDPGGAPLPAGMTLSPAGLLSVGAATAGTTAGVVFAYETA